MEGAREPGWHPMGSQSQQAAVPLDYRGGDGDSHGGSYQARNALSMTGREGRPLMQLGPSRKASRKASEHEGARKGDSLGSAGCTDTCAAGLSHIPTAVQSQHVTGLLLLVPGMDHSPLQVMPAAGWWQPTVFPSTSATNTAPETSCRTSLPTPALEVPRSMLRPSLHFSQGQGREVTAAVPGSQAKQPATLCSGRVSCDLLHPQPRCRNL